MNAPAKRTEDGRIRVINPHTWEVLATVRPTDPATLPSRIAECRKAQRLWAGRTHNDRVEVLNRVLARVVERADSLAEVIRSEHGKSLAEAVASEVTDAATVIKTHAKRDKKWLADVKVPIDPLVYPGKKAVIERRPRGVIALITPWNYPLALPMRTLVPALIAGNGVIFKPSEHALLVGREIAGLFEGLLPAGLLQLVEGAGEVGAALTRSEGLDAISFVGSVRTGKAIARAAAEQLVPVSLELGGKDAAIVCADSDIDRAVDAIAFGVFHNSGQNCAGIERIYVEETAYDTFVERFTAATRALRAEGGSEDGEVGPMTNQLQYDLVLKHIAEAKERGGRVLVGGEPTGQGWGITPAVVVDAPDDCLIWREETFGPVAPIRKVISAEEAVGLANDSPYGLGATVFCGDPERGRRLAESLEVGMAVVNNSHLFMGSIPTSPWVGAKQSGAGITGSQLAFDHLTRPQLVVVDRNKRKELWWFPFNGVYRVLMATNLKGLVTTGLAQVGVLVKMLGLLGKRFK